MWSRGTTFVRICGAPGNPFPSRVFLGADAPSSSMPPLTGLWEQTLICAESRSIGWGFSVAGSTLAIIESYGTAGKVMAHDRPASPCLVPDSGAAVGQVFVPDQDGAGLRGVIDGLEPGLLDQLLHLRLVFRCKSPPLTGVAHL